MVALSSSREPFPEGRSGGPVIGFLLLLIVVGLSSVTTVAATRHNSTTFDEIFMIASGARGYTVGEFDMTLDHPPVTQYLYGLPVYLAGAEFPEEADGRWGFQNRFDYAREFFWRSGNDPERIAFLGRLPGALVVGLLVITVFIFTRQWADDVAALLAAVSVAFLPDVLAHGGVAYNDVPLALAFLLGIWSLDRAAREPTVGRWALAAAVCTVALGIKFSGIALAPVALLLLVLEDVRRRGDRSWRKRVARSLLPVPLVVYATLVLIYLGDPTLEHFRWGLAHNIEHASRGHGVPAVLLGEMSQNGFWYFFPVAFFLKTPTALHALLVLAIAGFAKSRQGESTWRRAMASPLRGPVVGGIVFLAFIIRSDLNIGFRHALPLLPLVSILMGSGLSRLWHRGGGLLRAGVVALLVLHAGSALSYYPHFIPYLSEYVRSDDEGYRILVDSSLDWGQGLLALREFMEEEGVETVYLSYFGSALPRGYGIDYIPLPSYFPLPQRMDGEPEPSPSYVVVSATNLAGSYLAGDPFARFREGDPVRVLAHSLYVYPLAR